MCGPKKLLKCLQFSERGRPERPPGAGARGSARAAARLFGAGGGAWQSTTTAILLPT